MDILYDCAQAYKQLMDNEYHIKFSVDNEIQELILGFSEKEFKHLTGLEKLKDKATFHDLSSSTLLDYISNHNIVYDRSLYTNTSNIKEQIVDSKYLNDPINNINKSNTTYNVVDRISELANLYNLLHNATEKSMSVFKWPSNVSSDKRPNHSDINADLLLVFTDSVTKKVADETVCAFFIEEKGNNAAAMSIFPTDISYSDDGKVPPLHQCKILSFDEHFKYEENGLPKKTVTNLIKCSNEELKKCEQIEKDEKRNKLVKSKLYGLNDTRKSFLNSIKGKLDDNEYIQFQPKFSKYQTRLAEIASPLKTDIYIMKSIIDELQNLHDKTDPKEKLKLDLISDEINVINDSIRKILEHSQSVSNDLKSPVAALSSASSALTDDSGNGSNNVFKITFSSPSHQQIWGNNLHFSGQAAKAIELNKTLDYLPAFDMNKLIDGLKNLNEKITETIHNFADSFKRSREQPLQDHTARGRKINLSLPFPKEKPSQERTEPVTAKSEKAQKIEFKPAEHAEKKMMSWIAKEISSAKREASENNKNHEPKHHDKDQSL